MVLIVILTTANDSKNLFEIIFRVNSNSSVILVLYRLNKERHKLLGTMTNYSKSFIQIIMQKQTSFDLFKKNLK